MNKLIAISVLLLALNLYGADKKSEAPKLDPKTGLPIVEHKLGREILRGRGLEGWGKKEGVEIIVQDYSKEDKTFNLKAIENRVELKLRLAGIKVTDRRSSDGLYIRLIPRHINKRLVGYNLDIAAFRTVFFRYNGKEYTRERTRINGYGGIYPPNYKEYFDELMDKILLNYLKDNPKKEKE